MQRGIDSGKNRRASTGKNAERRGRRAETIAALLLMLKGYRLIAQRYKTPLGEIDLIAKSGDTFCFIEVKARATVDFASTALGPKQQKRIARAALYFAQQRRDTDISMRFDVILLAPWRLPRHIPNAWTADT